MILNVDGLQFDFPADWQASKYDDWIYYRQHLFKCMDGIKAVDILAFSPSQTAFLIEVKDYRHPDTVKPSQLPEAVFNKVLHTLAALLPAAIHANNAEEKKISCQILGATKIQVVLHVEQPRSHSYVVDLADLKQKLKRMLRAIDPHPKVVCMKNLQKMDWRVSD